jgi:O-acetyl-ADP-ribose deacetylase (regulator of RNase III)
MTFEVFKANIVNIHADAIVLPANEALKEGSGTSRAIFEAAGRKQLTKACKELGHCNTGSAIPTLAYDLDAKYIVHAVVPRWIDGEHNEYDRLSSAYISALKLLMLWDASRLLFRYLLQAIMGLIKHWLFRLLRKASPPLKEQI